MCFGRPAPSGLPQTRSVRPICPYFAGMHAVIGLVTNVGVANRHPVYNRHAVQTLPPDAAVTRAAFAVKWMLVVLSVLVWIVVAPIKEIFGEVVARVRGVGEG